MGILDIVFPKRCLGCGRIGKYFCLDCRKTIRYIHNATQPISFFRYEGIVQKAIKALKYRSVSDLAEEFISLVPAVDVPHSLTLVPIPLHPSRLRERGFNQAEVLGRLIAEKLHIPMRADILKRSRYTTPQVEMKKRNERIKNMKNAFISTQSPERVLLFDDVFTTGATMRTAGSALQRKGAKFVWSMTLAR